MNFFLNTWGKTASLKANNLAAAVLLYLVLGKVVNFVME